MNQAFFQNQGQKYSEIAGIYMQMIQAINQEIQQKVTANEKLMADYNLLKIDYLGHRKFDVYINEKDSERTEYLCSTSKLMGDDSNKPMIESKICSRFK